jgi:hypothetical protein
VLALSGCDTDARGDHFEAQLRDGVAEKLGPVASIECPEHIRIRTGDTPFTCRVALVSGDRGAIRVVLQRDGRLNWQTASAEGTPQ